MSWARKAPLTFVCLSLTALTGCVVSNPFLIHEDVPPHGDVRQVVATWNNEIVLTADPYNYGKQTPGITGRVYLFGAQIDFPRSGDGKMIVDLYDTSRQNESGQPVMLERWEFDPITLSRLLKRDMIGWGYTLFLPWGTFKPDVPSWNVLVKLSYQPANGTPLFTENPLTLNRPGGNNFRKTVYQQSGPTTASTNGPPNAAGSRPTLWPPEPLRNQPNVSQAANRPAAKFTP